MQPDAIPLQKRRKLYVPSFKARFLENNNQTGYILSKRYYSAGEGYEIRVFNNTLYAEVNPGGNAITLSTPIQFDGLYHKILVTFSNNNFFLAKKPSFHPNK